VYCRDVYVITPRLPIHEGNRDHVSYQKERPYIMKRETIYYEKRDHVSYRKERPYIMKRPRIQYQKERPYIMKRETSYPLFKRETIHLKTETEDA